MHFWFIIISLLQKENIWKMTMRKKKWAHPSFMARENKSWTRSLLILVALFTKGLCMKLSPTLRLSASQYFDLSIYRILDSLTFTISRTSGMFSFFWERDKGGMEETNFDCLPDDLIIRIFKNVSAEDLCTIYNVSKRFRRLAFDRSLVRWESPIARLSPCKPRKPLSRRTSRECQQKHRITSYRYSHILCPVDLLIEFHLLNVYVHIL